MVEPVAAQANETAWAGMVQTQFRPGGIMHTHLRFAITLSLTVIACQGRGSGSTPDSVHAQSQSRADSPAASSSGGASQPSGGAAQPTPSTSTGSAGVTASEPGTIPAKPTPSVTTESSLAAMRQRLQQLDNATVQTLQSGMKDHSKMLGDLLTTMRVEVQAAASPTKNTWLLSADSVEGDLDKLALADGTALQTAFREHRTRVLRLLDGFRALVPPKSEEARRD
jgi:hypothetical protein